MIGAAVSGFFLLYAVVTIVAVVLAARTLKSSWLNPSSENFLLASRDVGIFLGAISLTAALVGGRYTLDIVQNITSSGLVWCLTPIAYALSLVIGGAFFAKKMRDESYVTVLDPCQRVYGRVMASLFFMSAQFAEVMWCAALLASLGATIELTTGLNSTATIILCVCVVVTYTGLGGQRTIILASVLQLGIFLVGLWLAVPFSLQHPALGETQRTMEEMNDTMEEMDTMDSLLGTIPKEHVGSWIENVLVMTLGGIPMQSYMQRVLAAESGGGARAMSFLAAVACVLVAIPALILGYVGHAADWMQTDLQMERNDMIYSEQRILPLIMTYLCPTWVTAVGAGALGVGVMACLSASLLGVATMFMQNIYKAIFRSKASEKELVCVVRVVVPCVGVLVTVIAVTVPTINGLWYLASDIVYIGLFPQLACALYVPVSNTYGAAIGYIMALLLRGLSGDGLIDMPTVLKWPMYDDWFENTLFPFRTVIMLISLLSIVIVSYLTDYLFRTGKLPKTFDVFRCVANQANGSMELKEQEEFPVPKEKEKQTEKSSLLPY
jgi:high affinity choline transporter 7